MRDRWRLLDLRARVAAVAMVVLSGSFLVAWLMQPDRVAGPCAAADAPSLLPEIPEASGLAVSRRNHGLLWSHNDSGNAAILFAIDPAGNVHGRVRVPVRTRDWEDVSVARCSTGTCVYVADIGDNRATRQAVQIYRVPEPAADDTETAAPDVFNATYADGPHNAEAMFVLGTDFFIVTRDRSGGLYRATGASDHGQLKFERVGDLGLGAVTDAETSVDQKSVVVRTSHEAVLYRSADLLRGTISPYLRIPIDRLGEPQGEGVALDGDRLYLASEGRPWNKAGRLLSLSCHFAK